MTSPASTFDDGYFAQLDVVRDHWWVRGMREAASSLLGAAGPGLRVLDAGCGVGTNIDWLAELARPNPVVAVDFAGAALGRVRHRGHALVVQASVTDLSLAADHFDLVFTADVLQHLTTAQASAALAEMRRVLRPGGSVLVRTNSAFGRSAVTQRDDWRLYTVATLAGALSDAGLILDRITPVNAVQGLWASLSGRRSSGHDGGHITGADGGHDHAHGAGFGLGIPAPTSPARNAVLIAVMRLEALWLAAPGRRLPFGHSLYALARRPE